MRAFFLIPPFLIALLAAGAVPAGEPLTGAEFESYATGKTLTYALQGKVWGTEHYLPGRRVIWAYLGEDCKRGSWYQEQSNICFVYEDRPYPQCWQFFNHGQGLNARFIGDPVGMPLSELAPSPEPMPCPGPDLGV